MDFQIPFSRQNRTFFNDPSGQQAPLLIPLWSKNNTKMKAKQIILQEKFYIKENQILQVIIIELYDNMLVFVNGKASNLMKFKQLRFEKLAGDAEFPFGFTFLKNNQEVTIMTKEKSVFAKWNKIFQGKLIQHNFHEQYEVQKMIGKGHFAKVYQAINKTTLNSFAIKAFSKDYLLSQRDGQAGIINEINIMQKLNHKHCMHLYEIFETENSLYFVLDLIEGGELLKHIQTIKKQFTEREIRVIIRNILSAVNHCHQHQIMHRDIKPDNILVKILADFGLSAKFPKKIDKMLFKRCGTPGYIAPEVLKWKKGLPFYDMKCDVFSIGCIFYLLATGKKIFDETTQEEMIKINRECKINFNCPQHLSTQAQDLLEKMLMKDPANRISSQDAL